SLDGLVRELTADVKADHPTCFLECQLALDAIRVAAPGRLLHQTLLRLLRALLAAAGPGTRKVALRSHRVPEGVQLTVAEVPPEGRPDQPASPRRPAGADAGPWASDRHDC